MCLLLVLAGRSLCRPAALLHPRPRPVYAGNFPVAYSYPTEWRATRDLLRRRMYIARRCGELVAHIQNTNTQTTCLDSTKKLTRKHNHAGVAERFEDPEVRKSVEVDLEMIESLKKILKKLEWHIEKTARQHDYHTLYLLRSIPGVGQILALVILYEVHDIGRFPRVQDFISKPSSSNSFGAGGVSLLPK